MVAMDFGVESFVVVPRLAVIFPEGMPVGGANELSVAEVEAWESSV